MPLWRNGNTHIKEKMDIAELTKHPERLNRDTLYELRSLQALYPYYQNVRLLLLQNLYLLHDPTFDEELRQAAIYITDRRVLFQMIEAVHYRHSHRLDAQSSQNSPDKLNTPTDPPKNRTLSLINDFLDSIPQEEEPEEKKGKRRKPTPADAAVDYVAYLQETEGDTLDSDTVPKMKGQSLIDTFINIDKGRFNLSDDPQSPQLMEETSENSENTSNEGIFTETLARIYIKQGKYSQALEIIQRLSLVYPKKNAYFADQIRFLKKLIINNNTK